MTALALLITLVLSLFTLPFSGNAQGSAKVYRIGMLRPGSPPAGSSPNLDAFRQGMHDLGYIEGQHFVVESRWAEGSDERLSDLAAELVRLHVDVIMAAGALATHATQQATHTIPIVMLGVYDPVGAGLVASLAHPGGNITGVSTLGLELAGKRLELLKETVPQLRRVAVLANPAAPPHTVFLENLTVVSQELGLQLQVLEVRSHDELDRAFTALTQAGVEALFALPDPPLLDRLDRRIADLTAQHRLPAIYPFKSYVDAGGLMSYAPSVPDIYRRAAYYVDKIFKGAKPGDLPVEQPTKFEFVINLKAAKALGLTIPPTVLFQANEVLQ
jgi:putative ABC transport system substrate-binding protein